MNTTGGDGEADEDDNRQAAAQRQGGYSLRPPAFDFRRHAVGSRSPLFTLVLRLRGGMQIFVNTLPG